MDWLKTVTLEECNNDSVSARHLAQSLADHVLQGRLRRERNSRATGPILSWLPSKPMLHFGGPPSLRTALGRVLLNTSTGIQREYLISEPIHLNWSPGIQYMQMIASM